MLLFDNDVNEVNDVNDDDGRNRSILSNGVRNSSSQGHKSTRVVNDNVDADVDDDVCNDVKEVSVGVTELIDDKLVVGVTIGVSDVNVVVDCCCSVSTSEFDRR